MQNPDPKLIKAFKAKGKDYKPRTEHINSDGTPIYINHLILEDSPYLLQHAHNPVNWHAWTNEAFAKAKQKDKPIFLSVGYSTCHWCHVMEYESFENTEIAAFLNKYFISIKVDREQHPQIDSYYMSALTYMRSSGGWPMSAFLLPDAKAFHADTYLPPADFLLLLNDIVKLWQQNRLKVEEFALRVADTLKKQQNFKLKVEKIDDNLIEKAVKVAIENTDELQGGFGVAPKFPHENLLLFMLEQYARDQNPELRDAITITLDAMAHGGIYDQVGGGFHRYAIDNEWLVPHFEKMLYNQAMLARVYTLAYRLTSKPLYKRVATQTLNYVLRDMQDKTGAFHAATDADSGEGEGEYFIWTIEEVDKALNKDQAEFFKKFYGLSKSGNFEGSNILFIVRPHTDFARELGLSVEGLFNKLDTIHTKLLNIRNQRPLPFKDQKIISAWNGLMITALIDAYQTFAEDKYLSAAKKAADYIWHNKQGSYLPRIINSDNIGVLDDYVYLAEAVLSLYDASLNPKWLTRAETLVQDIRHNFKDIKSGGYFMNQIKADEPQIPKIKDVQDGAIYSATGALYKVFVRLFTRTGKDEYDDLAIELLSTNSGIISFAPTQNAYFLAAHADKVAGETGKVKFAGRGHVKIISGQNAKGKFIELEFDDKWHINSNTPLADNLIATRLTAIDGKLESVTYPYAQILKLGFSKSKLSLFTTDTRIYFTPVADNQPDKLALTLQACDDKNCLPPEEVIIYP